MFEYPKGSEWRKWDLHIHSNASDGKATPEEIIEEAQAKTIAVIALTDHHTFSNIDRIKELGKNAGITVISGIELRTEYGQKSVHIIGLFPDSYNGTILTQDALSELILGKLGITRTELITKGKSDDQTLSDDAAFKNGMFKVQVGFKEAANLIHKYGGIVSVHAGNKSNSIEEMRHDGNGITNVDLLEDSLGTLKEELLKEYIDICEIQKHSEAAFYLENFSRPSIAASDAHDKKSVGKKYTWIKADPSFEGLLQIKYEPELRLSIQETMPTEKPAYSIIDSVEIGDSLFAPLNSKTRIVFNPDLNCIIGGKSTGKSLLLNNIAYAIDKNQVLTKIGATQPESKKAKNQPAFFPISDVVVQWGDGSDSSIMKSNSKKIVYIPQTYLNRLSDEEEETTEVDTIIEEILLQDDRIKEKRNYLESQKATIKHEIDGFLYDYLQLSGKIKENENALLESNSSSSIRLEIQKLEEELKKYISDTAITEEQSTSYNTFRDKLQKGIQNKADIGHDIVSIEKVETIEISNPFSLLDLQQKTRDKLDTVFRSLQNEVDSLWRQKRQSVIDELSKERLNCDAEIDQISKELSILQPLVEKNESFLRISDNVSKQKKRLSSALKVEESLSSQKAEAVELLNKIVAGFSKYKNAYDSFTSYVNNTKSECVEGLNFHVETVFRSDAFRQHLSTVLNQKTISRFKKANILQITEEDLTSDVLEALVDSLVSNTSESIEIKAQYNMSVFLGEVFSDWYNVNYVVTMDNDNFARMSPGKKALVLLKLLIGLANSDSPMLIDQPEDDLDNRSIYDDLVKYIKEKKQERQIIIVTHNANIVVGADSEEILVANRDGENTPNRACTFEYVSGSIENSWKNDAEDAVLYSQGIKEHICEILEGGTLAFEKRADKYNLKPNL